MKTVGDIFQTFRQELQGHYEPYELETVSLWILGEVTGQTNAQLKAFPELELNEAQLKATGELLDKLKSGMPVQYATGRTEFYGLEFKVSPAVLIPRPETEELVAWMLQEIKEKPQTGKRVLDIGTGSGCIAVTLKKNLPDANVFALDVSKAALEVAHTNAEGNAVEINFIEADIMKFVPVEPVPYTTIVSNPPYVTQADKALMHNRVTGFEPHTALFVPEQEPLLFYEAIADFAYRHLIKDGLLFFEINESFGQEVLELLMHQGFDAIELRKDMQGKDRMIKAVR